MVRPSTPHPRKKPRTAGEPRTREEMPPAPKHASELEPLSNPASLQLVPGRDGGNSNREAVELAVRVKAAQESKSMDARGMCDGTSEGEGNRATRAGRVRQNPQSFMLERSKCPAPAPAPGPSSARRNAANQPQHARASAVRASSIATRRRARLTESEPEPPKPCATCKHILLTDATSMVLCDGCEVGCFFLA